MKTVQDDRGYNQGWTGDRSTVVRMERRCDYIIAQIRTPLAGSILEIGCGTGLNSYLLARKTGLCVLGTDLCVPFVEDANAKFRLPNLRYAVLDFNQADQFHAERFDYIVGNGILHHLYNGLDRALRNMRRLLADDGKIIFLEPNRYNPYVFAIFNARPLRRLARLEPDEMAFSRRHAIRLLRETGYRNIKVEYKDFLLPGVPDTLIAPLIAVGRVLEKVPVVRMISQSIFISAQK